MKVNLHVLALWRLSFVEEHIKIKFIPHREHVVSQLQMPISHIWGEKCLWLWSESCKTRDILIVQNTETINVKASGTQNNHRALSARSTLVTICTTRFNIKKFYVLPTECMSVPFIFIRTNWLFPFTALTGCFKKKWMRLISRMNWPFKTYWFRALTDLTLKNYTFCLHCIYVFCVYLRTNSDLCHLQHKLSGFYNPDEKCLQRGTDWVFK
jgi:hypothetical protein